MRRDGTDLVNRLGEMSSFDDLVNSSYPHRLSSCARRREENERLDEDEADRGVRLTDL